MGGDVNKQALVFECEGKRLIGILSKPQGNPDTITTALIALPAGGPQYRVGLGRQLVQLADYFCERNIAVLRFDYRGIGDSEGDFLGFRSVDTDLRVAIDALKEEIPSLKNLLLWGGCNAASGILIHAEKFTEVNGVIVNNPFLGEHNLGERARYIHFANRMRQKKFWLKVFSGRYDFKSYVKAFFTYLKQKFGPDIANEESVLPKNGEQTGSPKSQKTADSVSVLDEMFTGMRRYSGHCLLMLSGQSIQSNEFTALLRSSRQWRNLVKRPKIDVMLLADADQNFSSLEGREHMREKAYEWIVNTGLDH